MALCFGLYFFLQTKSSNLYWHCTFLQTTDVETLHYFMFKFGFQFYAVAISCLWSGYR